MAQDIYVICDNLRSLYNVGSIFRTSDAIGVKKIYLVGITGQPPQAGIAKVALGAENIIPWEYVKNYATLLKKIKTKKITLVALEQTKKSLPYFKFKPNFPLALVVGNEVLGVNKKLLAKCSTVVYLPQQGLKESLNVSVAFGVMAYYLRQSN
ncbi:MAG: TrmH family RNA methyltransferase [Candidatus Buchananbacteria bacterium]